METARLEILHFVPPALLEGVNLEDLPLDEFMRYIGRARFVEQLERQMLSKAIADVISGEKG